MIDWRGLINMNEYTKDGITYRVGDRVVSAPGRSAHEDEPDLMGRITGIEEDSEGPLFLIHWRGSLASDEQGLDDFTLLPR